MLVEVPAAHRFLAPNLATKNRPSSHSPGACTNGFHERLCGWFGRAFIIISDYIDWSPRCSISCQRTFFFHFKCFSFHSMLNWALLGDSRVCQALNTDTIGPQGATLIFSVCT
ncbi:hypothetical protein FHW77_005382 [Agrobacterium sp. RC10-4-1]|nr:hypothetical protein [Agrobacterium sp. RC10-4-1]